MAWSEKQDVADLQSLALKTMEQLTKLSNAALKTNESVPTQATSDLYYASNRAWHAIDDQVTALGKQLKGMKP